MPEVNRVAEGGSLQGLKALLFVKGSVFGLLVCLFFSEASSFAKA